MQTTDFLLEYIDSSFSYSFIKYRLEIERTDSTNYGIIYTPFDVIEKQLDQIPEEYFREPTYRWLDTGAGIGNYCIVLFKRLFLGLSGEIIDIHERIRHIMENMIFMVEIFPDHIAHLKRIFGLKANIIDRCFLSLDINLQDGIGQHHAIGQFDVIIGNPPYNINGSIKTPTNNKVKKSDDGRTVYVDFVIKSLDLLKPGGFLNYIIPSLWLKPDKAGLYRRLTNLKIHSLTALNTNDSQRAFKYQAQTPTCYFLVENTQNKDNQCIIAIWDKIINKYQDYRLLPQYPIPCYGVSIINKVLKFVELWGCLKPEKSNTLRKDVKVASEKSQTYPYKNITTCRLDGTQPSIQYNWSNRECQWSGQPKLVLAHKMYGFPFLDASGECGISTRDNYVFLGGGSDGDGNGELPNLETLQKYLSTKFALFIFGSTNYRMRYLEKYAFQFIPDILAIPEFDHEKIDCDRLGRDRYIADFFGLTEREREIVETAYKHDYSYFVYTLEDLKWDKISIINQ